MQFDVIIGNPPYQMADGGGEGSSAIPIYHKFVEQAKKLEPKQVVMVIPARWYSGGKGLDEFRDAMLTDAKLAEIHDFQETSLAFPNVNIRGGICFFLWSQAHSGDTKVTNYSKDQPPSTVYRQVLETGISTFVRNNEAISILKKVRKFNEETYNNRVRNNKDIILYLYYTSICLFLPQAIIEILPSSCFFSGGTCRIPCFHIIFTSLAKQ